jgi:hypothetical protein
MNRSDDFADWQLSEKDFADLKTSLIEFRIEPRNEFHCMLQQRALFRPRGLSGLLLVRRSVAAPHRFPWDAAGHAPGSTEDRRRSEITWA